MKLYNSSLDYTKVNQALTWHELERDTTAARTVALSLLQKSSSLYCV
jgi:hypothetical protein